MFHSFRAIEAMKMANLMSENLNELKIKLVHRIVDYRLFKDD